MPSVIFDATVYVPNPSPKCPICLSAANVYRRLEPQDLFEGWCAVCGDVSITLAAADKARQIGKAHFLSAALKRRPSHLNLGTVKLEDVDRILKDAPSYSELERMDLILTRVAIATERPGAFSGFQYTSDYPLVYASSPDEALFYLRELANKGYVKLEAANVAITMTGYERLHQLQRSGKQSNIAFVAMWFDTSRNLIYDAAISPAIREAGYQPMRIDKFEHVNRIDDEIIGQIRRSRFMVADFSGQRAGVYFEAGLMIGLGRTVIWMCEKKELGSVHFDTRQYNFIDYDSPADAKKRLLDRILAIEGEGSRASE